MTDNRFNLGLGIRKVQTTVAGDLQRQSSFRRQPGFNPNAIAGDPARERKATLRVSKINSRDIDSLKTEIQRIWTLEFPKISNYKISENTQIRSF